MSDAQLNPIIVGSGPSGLALAKALTDAGRSYTLVDGGLEIEPELDRRVGAIALKPPWRWSQEDRALIKSKVVLSSGGVKEKKVFGSNFASSSPAGLKIDRNNANFYTSFARTGLANIWGAGLMPMASSDMTGWPISLSSLEPHYRGVMSFLPFAGHYDQLESDFPLYGNPHPHPLSSQALHALARAAPFSTQLRERGLTVGASRLAARFSPDSSKAEGESFCRSCALCMYGCAYRAIFSGQETLSQLISSGTCKYLPGYIVKTFSEDQGKVTIRGVDVSGAPGEPIVGSRLVIAAGPFATAKIVLESLNLIAKEITVKTSDQFYQPLITSFRSPNITNEPMHTMSQVFWALRDPSVSPYYIHSSLYMYNDMYLQTLQNLLGKFYPTLKYFVTQFLERFCFSISYLHSDHSATLKTQVINDSLRTLKVEGVINPASEEIIKKLKKKWRQLSRYTGMFPAPFYNSQRLPGAGNHNGGSFPMRRSPKDLETSTNGMLYGFERVHIADSSIMPSITASTITLSIMANAHRIGTELAELP
jgi:choline dehydrogenase-like flavoprotein